MTEEKQDPSPTALAEAQALMDAVRSRPTGVCLDCGRLLKTTKKHECKGGRR